MKRILINGLALTQTKCGYLTVLKEFLKACDKNPFFQQEVQLIFCVQKSALSGLEMTPDDLPNIEWVVLPNIPSKYLRGIIEQVLVPWLALYLKADAIHMPNTFGLLFSFRPVIQFFHTATSFQMPSALKGRSRLQAAIHNFLIKHSSTRSDVLTVTTDTTAKELLAFLGMSRPYIKVGNGAPNLKQKLAHAKTSQPSEEVFKKVDGKQLLLSVSSFFRLKNHKTTIEAFLKLEKENKLSEDAILVVAGSLQEPDYYEECLALANTSDRVFLFHDLDDKDIAYLYSQCQLYIFISLFEGFGLTPLEALLFECPILLSNLDVLQEVYGNDFLYVPPKEVNAVADGILKALDSNYHQTCHDHPVLQKYTWEAFAQKHIGIYSDLLELSKPAAEKAA